MHRRSGDNTTSADPRSFLDTMLALFIAYFRHPIHLGCVYKRANGFDLYLHEEHCERYGWLPDHGLAPRQSRPRNVYLLPSDSKQEDLPISAETTSRTATTNRLFRQVLPYPIPQRLSMP